MAWKERDRMSLRRELVELAKNSGVGVRELCRRFEISPKTAYKWINRYRVLGESELQDQSRKPLRSPGKTSAAIEDQVLRMRQSHPAWGGRKIRARLKALGISDIPATSTITDILRRHGQIDPMQSAKHTAWTRFEHPRPNDLWQMDFKGHFALSSGRCHPLTGLDDHSRFALGLEACADEKGQTVKSQLEGWFRRYGLPWRILMDNGAPWRGDPEAGYSALSVWLMRLGVSVTHGRPYHPQTQGKDERFHRTLEAELLKGKAFRDLLHCQEHFNRWREMYNHERPHEALGMAVPATRYQPSPRAFPETLPRIEYAPGQKIRRVWDGGWFNFEGRTIRIGKAFEGYPVALRTTTADGIYEVVFCQEIVMKLNLKEIPKEA